MHEHEGDEGVDHRLLVGLNAELLKVAEVLFGVDEQIVLQNAVGESGGLGALGAQLLDALGQRQVVVLGQDVVGLFLALRADRTLKKTRSSGGILSIENCLARDCFCALICRHRSSKMSLLASFSYSDWLIQILMFLKRRFLFLLNSYGENTSNSKSIFS